MLVQPVWLCKQNQYQQVVRTSDANIYYYLIFDKVLKPDIGHLMPLHPPPLPVCWPLVPVGIDLVMHRPSWQQTMLANNNYLLSSLIKVLVSSQILNCLQQLIHNNCSSALLCSSPSVKMPSCPCCSNHTKLVSGGCDRSRFLYFPLCLLVCFSIAVPQLLRLAFIDFKHTPLLQIQKHGGSVQAHSHQPKDKT